MGLAGFDIFFTPNLPVLYVTPQGNQVPATGKKAIDMSLSDELFALAEPHWVRQVQHPFVRGLSDGTLEENRFIRWVLQDYRYLKEYAKVFAWAVAKADRLEALAWYSGRMSLYSKEAP